MKSWFLGSCIPWSLTKKQYFHEALLQTSVLYVTQHGINEINQRINYLSLECSGEAIAKVVHGVIGVGVFVALKYCYPSVKKFFQKHQGLESGQNDDGFIANFCNLSPFAKRPYPFPRPYPLHSLLQFFIEHSRTDPY